MKKAESQESGEISQQVDSGEAVMLIEEERFVSFREKQVGSF